MKNLAVKSKTFSLDGYVIGLSGRYISDLFFNFDLENYKNFMKDRWTDDDMGPALDLDNPELRAALMKDAAVFASCCGMGGVQGFREACVEDFLERV